MEDGTVTVREVPRGRVDAALRSRANWEQLVKFCVVGAIGYAVNLVVYTLLLKQAGLHYTTAAIWSTPRSAAGRTGSSSSSSASSVRSGTRSTSSSTPSS